MVYFARVDIAQFKSLYRPVRIFSYIKIGCSVHPKERMSQLKGDYSGKRVVLLAVIEGGPEEEQAMHKRFDHLRIAPGRERNGTGLEWFHPTDELMAFIETLKKKKKSRVAY